MRTKPNFNHLVGLNMTKDLTQLLTSEMYYDGSIYPHVIVNYDEKCASDVPCDMESIMACETWNSNETGCWICEQATYELREGATPLPQSMIRAFTLRVEREEREMLL